MIRNMRRVFTNILIILNLVLIIAGHLGKSLLLDLYIKHLEIRGIPLLHNDIYSSLPLLTTFFIIFYWLPYIIVIISVIIVWALYKADGIYASTYKKALLSIYCGEFLMLLLLIGIYYLPFNI